MDEKYLYFKLTSLHGSITHYYHFFYGVLIPLILEHVNNLKNDNNNIIYIIGDDVGQMLKILTELPMKIKLKHFIKNFQDLKIKTKFLQPMDVHPTITNKDKHLVKKGWALMLTNDMYNEVNIFMKFCVNKYKINLQKTKTNKLNVVIIERKKHKGFSTVSYEKNEFTKIMKTSGSERRSIINHEEFENTVKKYFNNNEYDVLNISTEYMSIFEQYDLFNNADIVIAQHGAALANIIFMNSKATVIEIISKVKLNANEDWFKPISSACKINHVQYITEEEHTNINTKDFVTFLKEKI
jgi:hypothetical protein